LFSGTASSSSDRSTTAATPAATAPATIRAAGDAELDRAGVEQGPARRAAHVARLVDHADAKPRHGRRPLRPRAAAEVEPQRRAGEGAAPPLRLHAVEV
jgi:hypothetical protein